MPYPFQIIQPPKYVLIAYEYASASRSIPITNEKPETPVAPRKIRMPLYRHVEENAQLLEFKCVEFVEELIYGHLRKKDLKGAP